MTRRDTSYYEEVRRALGRGAPSGLLGTSTKSLERSLSKLKAVQQAEDASASRDVSDSPALEGEASGGGRRRSTSKQRRQGRRRTSIEPLVSQRNQQVPQYEEAEDADKQRTSSAPPRQSTQGRLTVL